ncbi:MAG: hypothetical protein ACFFBP_18460 [Promethearchaeota archaeon]
MNLIFKSINHDDIHSSPTHLDLKYAIVHRIIIAYYIFKSIARNIIKLKMGKVWAILTIIFKY